MDSVRCAPPLLPCNSSLALYNWFSVSLNFPEGIPSLCLDPWPLSRKRPDPERRALRFQVGDRHYWLSASSLVALHRCTSAPARFSIFFYLISFYCWPHPSSFWQRRNTGRRLRDIRSRVSYLAGNLGQQNIEFRVGRIGTKSSSHPNIIYKLLIN